MVTLTLAGTNPETRMDDDDFDGDDDLGDLDLDGDIEFDVSRTMSRA